MVVVARKDVADVPYSCSSASPGLLCHWCNSGRRLDNKAIAMIPAGRSLNKHNGALGPSGVRTSVIYTLYP